MPKSLKIYIISSVVLILFLLSLNLIGLNLKGEYTYQILAWTWIIFTFYIVIKFWKIIYIKIYGFLLFALVGLSILPMAIPFVSILSFLFNMNTIQTIKFNDEYKIVVTKKVMAKKRAYIYNSESKFLILEKSQNIARPDYNDIVSETLNINSDDPKRYEYVNEPIQQAKLVSVNKDSIGIEYQILNKKKIIYHNLNETYGY
ncbi:MULTISPECIES: hypothetical protein [Empedobacter]|uniref:hypothetical protein n=1 Tax=Empedobacter TaxID=59734 RepID=UPI0025762D75|nr:MULTISPECIES: hypothetical protein [Empedobacter]MDM1042640.1 hypothetical protein [Empedobacter brevis]MDM1136597.1 hypothetical protein [Empedobacter sp. R750]